MRKILAILLVLASTANARDYPAQVIRVIDGDTLVASVDLGFNLRLVESVRLSNVMAPEMNQSGGPEAKKALETLTLGRQIIIRTGRRERDKYGRILAEIIQ